MRAEEKNNASELAPERKEMKRETRRTHPRLDPENSSRRSEDALARDKQSSTFVGADSDEFENPSGLDHRVDVFESGGEIELALSAERISLHGLDGSVEGRNVCGLVVEDDIQLKRLGWAETRSAFVS